MPTIESIVRQINREFVPQFEDKLRAYLADQDKEWLIEQIVRLTLDAHSLEEMDRQHTRQEETKRREERAARIRLLNLNLEKLKEFLAAHKGTNRERLVKEGFLKAEAAPKGGEMIPPDFRTKAGNDLLLQAKDMLFGLLFGDREIHVNFQRVQRELLTLTVPRMKSEALNFMKATTELNALGTWQDPNGTANDARADNMIMEIEYGEVEGEFIGDGIVTALRLINNLEINEEILYGRMEDIEQSTLISQKMVKI